MKAGELSKYVESHMVKDIFILHYLLDEETRLKFKVLSRNWATSQYNGEEWIEMEGLSKQLYRTCSLSRTSTPITFGCNNLHHVGHYNWIDVVDAARLHPPVLEAFVCGQITELSNPLIPFHLRHVERAHAIGCGESQVLECDFLISPAMRQNRVWWPLQSLCINQLQNLGL